MRGWLQFVRGLLGAALLLSLAGCPLDYTGAKPQDRSEAARFLNQATFGPDEDNLQNLMAVGYEAWIDQQFANRPSLTYRAFMTQRDAEIKADNPGNSTAKAGPAQVLEAFYTRALDNQVQLRSRLAYALSQIFVVSFVDEGLGTTAPEMVAAYMDTLEAALDGSYRDLLETISKSPAMGQYLTFRGNSKETPELGHSPDENYAREIMQLFSIGLYELNPDGTVKLDANGQAIETYTNDDIKGLAKVFTGWSNYAGPAYANLGSACFSWNRFCRDPEGFWHPMVEYPEYHSTSEKRFLGITIAPQSTPSPQASLTAALDRLATHPNTAPFVSRQLIQRLVPSNPSPAYVGRVAQRFVDTGGNIKEIVKAILMDDEARGAASLSSTTHGKVREPVLRLTALLRAFKVSSPTLSTSNSPLDPPTGNRTAYLSAGITNAPGTSWGQAPLHAPSVFNFFRPGYTPPQSLVAEQRMVAPEMQLVNETTVTGYVNAVLDLLSNGIGPTVVVDGDGQCGAYTPQIQQYILALDPKVPANKALQDAAATCKLETISQRDIMLQLTEQRAMAYDVGTLAQHMADRLLGGQLSDGLRQAMLTALSTIDVPQPDAQQSNGEAINAALDKRVWGAIALVAASPEFLITK